MREANRTNKAMKSTLLAAGLLLATLGTSQALVLSFDSGVVTAGTGEPLGTTFTIEYAVLETVDENGDPVVPYWIADPTGTPVAAATADYINAMGYGPATSAALDAEVQPILFTFASPVDLAVFSTKLDNSGFGNLADEFITFYDASDTLIASIRVSQGTPGFVVMNEGVLTGVTKVVLPTTAFYDDMVLLPVPEPGIPLLGVAGALGLAMGRRRKLA